jgi:hypothetical protein
MSEELRAYIILYFSIAILLVLSASALLISPIPTALALFKIIVSLIVFVTPIMLIFKIFEIGNRE